MEITFSWILDLDFQKMASEIQITISSSSVFISLWEILEVFLNLINVPCFQTAILLMPLKWINAKIILDWYFDMLSGVGGLNWVVWVV